MSMIRILARVEMLKIRKRRAFWVATAFFAVLNGIATVQLVRRAARTGADFALPDAWPSILGSPAGPGPFFLGVLMILLFAPEFRWKTSRQNVIDGLSRTRFGLGKVLVLGWLVAVFAVLPVVIGGAGALVSPTPSTWPWIRLEDLSYVLGYATSLLLVGSGSFMIAALIRSSGPGIGLLFVYMMLEDLVRSTLFAGSEALETAMRYLPGSLSDLLGEDLVHYPETLARYNAQLVEQGRDPAAFPDVNVLFLAALGYTAVFLAVAFASLRKRDF